MMAAVRAYRVLTSQDEKCNDYVAAYANVQVQTSQVAKTDAAAPAGGAAGADALFEAVRRGLKNEARAAAEEALKNREPLQVVNETLIPALDVMPLKKAPSFCRSCCNPPRRPRLLLK